MKVLVACLALAGCAALDHQAVAVWSSCGDLQRQRYVDVYVSGAPFIDCPRMALANGDRDWGLLALQLPIACTIITGPGEAVVILPPHAPEWVVDHEFGHVMDRTHAFLLPAKSQADCNATP